MSFAHSLGRVGAGVAKALLVPLGRKHSVKALASLSDAVAPVVDVSTPIGNLRFRCFGSEAMRIPVQFATFDPEIREWVDAFLQPSECLWDIGAHIGTVALYAALKIRGAGRVIAFEPSAASYASLNDNIMLSKLQNDVEAYCIALSDKVEIGRFHMSDPRPANACHAYGQPRSVFGDFTPAYSQAAIALTVDQAISQFGMRSPDHIKLDVDSNEDAILRGAEQALKKVKSLMIEIDEHRSTTWVADVKALLREAGLSDLGRPQANRNILFVRES